MAQEFVTIETRGGALLSGRSLRAELTQLVLVLPEAEQTIAIDDVVAVQFVDARPRSEAEFHVQLANGDRLSAKSVTLADEKVQLIGTLAGNGLKLNLEWLSEIARGDFSGELARGRDQILLTSGDVMTGELRQLTAEVAEMKSALGEMRIPMDEVQRIAFDPELQLTPKPFQTGWDVTLRDGSQLSCTRVKTVDSNLELKWSPLGECSVPISEVLRINRRNANFIRVQLTDAKIKEERSYFGVPIESRKDQQYSGGVLKLERVPFRFGIGTIAQSKLTFPIPQRAKRFRVKCGLADLEARNGSAIASVEIDGTAVWKESLVQSKASAISIDLQKITDPKTVTLYVRFGARGDSQSYVNWCEPMFIR